MARQAPFGTDEQPSLATKIVAGKPVEVNARSYGWRNDRLSRTPYKYSTRPPWFLDDDPADNRKSDKLRLSSLSNSLTSDSQKPLLSMKPEIGKASCSEKRNEATIATGHQELALEEAKHMDFMLSRLLSEFSPSNIRAIYTEMAEHDPRLRGYISEHQVETVLKRHKFPLPSTMLKLVLPQFVSKGNVNMINYEALIKYLFSFCVKPPHVRKPSDEMKVGLNSYDNSGSPSETTNTPHSVQTSHVSPRSLVKKAMDDREEAYLLVQIEQTFKTSGPKVMDILEQLHRDLSKLSNGTGYVKSDQIERTCSWLQVPLHHTLLGKILNRFDVRKNGKIDWLEFIAFLEKGVPLSIQQSSTVGSKRSTGRSPLPFWETQMPLAPVQVSPRRGNLEKETTEEKRVKNDSTLSNGVFPKERKKWDTRQPEEIQRSYDILKVENFRNNDSGGSSVNDRCDTIESGKLSRDKADTMSGLRNEETTEDKLERFSHLTEALLRSDVDKNGTLKAKDVLRIVNNYNLIYNLHFPGDKIQEVIRRYTLKNTDEVVIEDLARGLWDLIK